ncbi:MAG: hypothetical protein FWG44_08390, partial [Oscillospiraceae bacterium]|nr:hypothetical protein [Oscillospiraceae bacterium]
QTAGKAELSGITDIDISDYMDIRMIYNGKIELHIGTEAELELKFRAAAGLIETESGNWSDKGTLRLVDPSRAVFQPAEMFEEVVLPIAPEAILAEIPEE